MKKEYIVPSMEIVNVEPIVMMSSSDPNTFGISDVEVDTSTQQLGQSRRDSWGSIW